MYRTEVAATVILAVVFAGLAGGATAEPVDGASARRALFSPRGAEVEVLDRGFLSTQDKAILNEVGVQLLYYGAVAVSPDEGILANATIAAADHHSTEAAEIAALAACNAARNGATACEIVALIRPRGWSEGAVLQLGQSATQDFRSNYRRGRGPKALAISPATGQWAIVKGDAAETDALRECNLRAAEKGATDCNVAVRD